MALIHSFELLTTTPGGAPACAAVFGSDATLRFWSIGAVAGDGDITQYEGDAIGWSDIRDDLATGSLFDLGGKRTIVVRDADKFVSANRDAIEKHLAVESAPTRLLLELGALAANTRIYKTLREKHLLVACSGSIDTKLGVTAASRRKFLTGYVASRHRTRLVNAAADALIELLGDDIGVLDTEIAKLAVYREPGEAIDEPLVREIVEGWKGKTIWQITDAIADGDAAEALRQLEKLIHSGQRPIALLPQIAWSLRRLGMATAVVEHCERAGRTWRLEEALQAAGIHRPGEIQRAKRQLKAMGRPRARQLLPWLLDADLRLKGTHSQDGRDRALLEQLVMRLAKGAG